MAKVIVITGASAGIGKELAQKLAARGDYLMLAARNAQVLQQISRSCGRDTFAYTTDVTRRQDVNRLRDEAIRTFDHVDVWINNAGRGITQSVLDLTDQDMDEMMAVNYKSAVYGMQAILPHFLEKGSGHVINVSSGLGRLPFSTQRSAYSAAKSALNNITTSARLEIKRLNPNINISLVIPGPVDTEFAQNSLHSTGGMAGMINVQTVSEVADAIIQCIDQPKAEVYTNPSVQVPALMNYLQDIDAFESRMLGNK